MKIKKYKLKYSESDIRFVKNEIQKTLELGYLTDGGPNVELFENMWSNFNGSKNSIAVSSCTTGLECILRAIDVAGKSVVVPAYTFIASVMSIYNCGGKPVYCDIAKETLGLSLKNIKKAVRSDTKAVMIVHVGGVITNEIVKIREYCDSKGLILIEDAACAHGAEFNNIKSGNFGHAACFSFHHSKVLTCGEGGIITTSSDELAKKIRRIRAIGLDRKINNYESFEIGSNSKMSEVTAILAILHVKNAKKIIAERRKLAKLYDEKIKFNSKIVKFEIPNDTKSGYYKYFIRVNEGNTHLINEFFEYAKSLGIDLPPRTYSYTCDEQNVSKKMNCIVNSLENSYFMKNHHFCLPMYNNMTKEEINYIIDVVNKFIENVNAN